MSNPAADIDPDRISVTGGYVAAIMRALEARGVAIEAILEASGIARIPSNSPLDRVGLADVRRLLGAAVELTGDPYFGLYAAKFMHATNMHALGYALLASGSLRDFCQRLVRYFRVLSGNPRPRLCESGSDVRLEFPLVAEAPPLGDDVLGLFLVDLIRELSDGAVHAIRVELHRQAPPDDGVRHQRAFGCPVQFGVPYTSLIFALDALDIPLAGASRELAEHNEKVVIAYLSKLERNDIQMRLRALLLHELPAGGVTKEGIAKKMFMSPRTLQIKLAKVETTFQDVVNETRRALACGYIENSGMSITEIAYMLGFSDTSNFSRAFRRWTGHSPRAYASQLRHGNGTAALAITPSA